jgi:hypothetical protein
VYDRLTGERVYGKPEGNLATLVAYGDDQVLVGRLR